MPANYSVIRDAPVRLRSGADIDARFTFDADNIQNNRAVVLTYRAAPGNPAADLTASITPRVSGLSDFGTRVTRRVQDTGDSSVPDAACRSCKGHRCCCCSGS